jgi:hypothetical protein
MPFGEPLVPMYTESSIQNILPSMPNSGILLAPRSKEMRPVREVYDDRRNAALGMLRRLFALPAKVDENSGIAVALQCDERS